jgi:hypothetical protein
MVEVAGTRCSQPLPWPSLCCWRVHGRRGLRGLKRLLLKQQQQQQQQQQKQCETDLQAWGTMGVST